MASTRLSRLTHPFLWDHVLAGRPVYPLAAALDAMAAHADLTPPFVLRDVRVERGLVLWKDTAAFEVTRAGDVLGLEEVRPTGRRVRAFSTRIVEFIGVSANAETEFPPVTNRIVHPISLAEFYARNAFHGPRLQAIVEVSAERLEGRVRRSRPRDWQDDRRDAWHLDPLVIDGAFQLALYFSLAGGAPRILPRAIERLTVSRPFDGDTVLAAVRPRSATVCDVVIDGGAVVIEGLVGVPG